MHYPLLQLRKTKPLHEISFGKQENLESFGMSSSLIYPFEVSSEDQNSLDGDCQDSICSLSYKFIQRRDTTCKWVTHKGLKEPTAFLRYKVPCFLSFKMICTTLEDNPCGDFGIDLNFSDNGSEKVCRQGQLHSDASLSYQSTAEIKLWYYERSNYQVC